ncbi:element excision factor XisH family protein [Thiothrix lacustris]|uniref:element excision factor XisH family protein n=1 Tax=Thiothrix lacustris TaxID=525917 RepID=UPI0027E55656|nr:element excision factor XisH family protein [Thiothrix lacustris]WMP16726.1 element excision factor XisH family protein [Thiothrix lacustris]
MPARDIYHNTVKHALEKGGWNVTADPFLLRAGAISMYVDLGAERLLAANRNEEKRFIFHPTIHSRCIASVSSEADCIQA